MNCPKCNTPVAENNKFCPHCGATVPTLESTPTICKNCNLPLPNSAKFCSRCGSSTLYVIPNHCSICNSTLKPDEKFCKNCGASRPSTPPPQTFQMPTGSSDSSATNTTTSNSFKQFIRTPSRSLPAFILGLVASVFGILGGFCTTLCSSLFSSGAAPFILILGGSIVGLIGACQCLKKALKGSALQLIAAIMIGICAYGLTGADFMSMLALVLFIAGTCTAFITHLITYKR